MTRNLLLLAVLMPLFFFPGSMPPAAAQKNEPIPHAQDRPPGPPLSPAEAIKKMIVPKGFSVELVAAEPNIVNPVAMTFDERGRIWITESLEYPRRSSGPGKDRIKILESTKGDGNYDKISIFMNGLNIPSGIAVGHGGVWIANAPDILFVREANGKPVGKPEVVVTGFGRTDTHELPNSLTWGPDGWLYGLNGVFNHSHIKHRGKDYIFTCALFRIHPRTKDFELFCEGTSNPWGVAFDHEGSAFISACVIDHLWHLTQTGYYHRQGGPYPPFTWKIGSIVKHRHQKAAYCGIHFFDSDAYPPEYRGKLYMGNIHGGCINCDELTRDGSTYFAKPRPDFLTANDAWFMPVVQKTGPDGCLYILDWYDRYHCYQDANRDPQGIDRLRGRLYRVRYQDTPRAGLFDLGKETDDQLIARLHSPNVFYRDLAQRLLGERNSAAARPKLQQLILDDRAPRTARLHALFALVGTGSLETDFHLQLLAHADPGYRAWGVRAAGNFGKVEARIRERILQMAKDSAPDVQLQVAIAARKLDGVDPLPVLLEVMASSRHDPLIPHIVWQNLHPLLEQRHGDFLSLLYRRGLHETPTVAKLMPRILDRLLAMPRLQAAVLAGLIEFLSKDKGDGAACAESLALLSAKVHTGEIAGPRLEELRQQLRPLLHRLSNHPHRALTVEANLLAATFKDPVGIQAARQILQNGKQPEGSRLKALSALVATNDGKLLEDVAALLDKGNGQSLQFRGQVLAALGKHGVPQVADVVLHHYPKMEPELQPKAIELLTERPVWSKRLLAEIAQKKILPNVLHVNQVRKLQASKDKGLVKQVTAVWGTVREGRNPQREKIVADMRELLGKTPGNAKTGVGIFKKVCAQCHKIYGEGVDVGPDITANGRSDFEQLLSNVFDPSLVIGAGYQGTTVVTDSGQVITGLLVEDNAQRVVLKVQGGEVKTIPRSSIEQFNIGKVSMMPEDLEKQLSRQEIADLFAFLVLDRPPDDPKARLIRGAPRP